MDLFDDLPEPVNPAELSSAAVQNMLPSDSEWSAKGKKRKLDEVNDLQDDSDINVRNHGPPVIVRHRLRGCVSELQGEREEMQDANFVVNDFLPQIGNVHADVLRVSLYGVFDGHAGCRASRYLAANLPTSIAQKFPRGHLSRIESQIGKCLIDAFRKIDEDFLKEAAKRKPTWKDGSTAIVVLAVNDTLYIANLGDSKAVLCRYSEERSKCIPIALSREHSPTQYDERMRIQKAGGNIRDGRVMGVLEVSRSIGDGQYKTCGVIATPDIKRYQLTDNDRFVLIACDGLWKTFSSDDAVQFVDNAVQEYVVKNVDTEGKGSQDNVNSRYDMACLLLTKEAVRRGCGDNVTVVVVSIDALAKSLGST